MKKTMLKILSSVMLFASVGLLIGTKGVEAQAAGATITAYGFPSIYGGALENAIDGDDSTYVWFGGAPTAGASLEIDYGSLQTLSSIRILTGTDDTMVAEVFVSEDGSSYVSVGNCFNNTSLNVVELFEAPVNARYVKLVDSGTPHWVQIKEIGINVFDSTITYENILIESTAIRSKFNMVDHDTTTWTWFDVNRTSGAYFQLDLLNTKTVNNIQLLMAKPSSTGDFFPEVIFSYSVDGDSFTNIPGTYSGIRQIIINLDTPISARYIRATSTTTSSCGVVIRDFSVNNVYSVSFGNSYKVYDYARANYEFSHVDFAVDGNVNTFLDLETTSVENDKWVMLDLFSVKSIDLIQVTTGVNTGDAVTTCQASYSVDGSSFTSLGNQTSASGAYTLSLHEPISARYIKFSITDAGWKTINEISATLSAKGQFVDYVTNLTCLDVSDASKATIVKNELNGLYNGLSSEDIASVNSEIMGKYNYFSSFCDYRIASGDVNNLSKLSGFSGNNESTLVLIIGIAGITAVAIFYFMSKKTKLEK